MFQKRINTTMLVYTSKGPFTIVPIPRTAQVVIKEMQPNGCIDIECWTSLHTGVVVTYDAYKKGKVVQYSRLKRNKKAGQRDFLGIYPTGPKRQENVLKSQTEQRVSYLNERLNQITRINGQHVTNVSIYFNTIWNEYYLRFEVDHEERVYPLNYSTIEF